MNTARIVGVGQSSRAVQCAWLHCFVVQHAVYCWHMSQEPHKPSLESLLVEMIANQQSINENIEAIYEKLTQLERSLEGNGEDHEAVFPADDEDDFEGPDFDDIEDDELYEDAKMAVIRKQVASESFLQKQLDIDLSRAKRLLDMLEEDGIISAKQNDKPRTVLVEA